MNRDDKLLAQVGRYTELAFVLPAGAVAGALAGYLLDRLFHTGFLWLIFLVFGVAGGFIQLLRQLTSLTKHDGS
jgi:F0F1-type ATP synthase assembly protein I